MDGAITACFIGVLASGIDLARLSAAYVLYRNGPPVSRGSCRRWPSAKMAKYWPPSPASWSASPVPARVSVIA
jgi:hypothetical protein